MDEAIAIINDKKRLINISAVQFGNINEMDLKDMQCKYCRAKVHIYHRNNGTMAFRALPHNTGCPILSEDGQLDEKLKLKKKRIYTNTFLNNDLILYGKDRAPIEHIDTAPIHDQDDPIEICTPDELNSEMEEFYYEFKIKNINSVGPLFADIQSHGLDYNMGDGRTAAELVLDNVALHKIRREGFVGLKIALLTRCKSEDLPYLRSIGLGNIPGKTMEYVYLKDAYAADIKNAIIFKVRTQNEKQNEYFKNLAMGSNKAPKQKPDKRDFIVIYTYWKQLANDYAQVYTANITFRQYAFVSNIKIGTK